MVTEDLPVQRGMVSEDVLAAVRTVLSEMGGRFALLFGSRVRGDASARSDVDVAVMWREQDRTSAERRTLDAAGRMPGTVDLLTLDYAPLRLAGKVACEGVPVFVAADDDLVSWLAHTRKIYLDELPRMRHFDRIALEAMAHG